MGYSPWGRKESDMTERYMGIWVWVYLINNVVIVSGARQRDSAIHTCIHSPTVRTCFLSLLCPGCVCFLKPSP